MVSQETENTELSIEKATKRSELLASLSFHRDASATVCSSICANVSHFRPCFFPGRFRFARDCIYPCPTRGTGGYRPKATLPV